MVEAINWKKHYVQYYLILVENAYLYFKYLEKYLKGYVLSCKQL